MDAFNELSERALGYIWPRRVPPLKRMLVHPDNREQNPLMVGAFSHHAVAVHTYRCILSLQIQFYTWESRGTKERSWWNYFEQEVPHLEDLGVSHVWLPPMSKGQSKDVNRAFRFSIQRFVANIQLTAGCRLRYI